MLFDNNFVSSLLRQDYEKKKRKNKSFSQRAYAKSLGLDASLVSKVMRGERPVSSRVRDKIQKVVKVPRSITKKTQTEWIRKNHPEVKTLNRQDASFFFSSWETLAFMARISSGTFKGTSQDLARDFGVSLARAQEVYSGLIENGFCSVGPDGYHVCHSVAFGFEANRDDILRQRMGQLKVTELGKDVLLNNIAESGISTMTLNMSSRCLDLAKSMIRQFEREACTILEEESGSSDDTKVYAMQIQLFPLTK